MSLPTNEDRVLQVKVEYDLSGSIGGSKHEITHCIKVNTLKKPKKSRGTSQQSHNSGSCIRIKMH